MQLLKKGISSTVFKNHSTHQLSHKRSVIIYTILSNVLDIFGMIKQGGRVSKTKAQGD